MKTTLMITSLVVLCASAAMAQPLRVAVLDFEDRTGQQADARLGGQVDSARLAAKGLHPLGRLLVNSGDFVLLDRRDFIRQVENTKRGDDGRPADATPSYLHAAQALRADAVLRGGMMSLSTSKRTINQGGLKSEFAQLSLRVALEALDATDGSIMAMSEGVARRDFRQTAADQTEVDEDALLELMEEAIAKAVPSLQKTLNEVTERNRARPRVKLSISSTVDPALVEIDGILIGSTPLQDFEVYKGDHILTVGKAGHRDITKRILLEKDAHITVPLFRTELSADELKKIMENARVNAYIGAEPALVIDTVERIGN